MPAPTFSVSAFLEVLRRLQGRGGVTGEPGSIRSDELEAMATAANDGAGMIRDAGRAAFPSRDTTATGTDEWEDLLRVVQDFPVATLALRVARIIAYRSLRDPRVPADLRAIVEAFSGTTTTDFGATTTSDLQDDATLEPEALLAPWLALSSWPAGGRVNAGTRALVRSLPGRAIPLEAMRELRRAFVADDDAASWTAGTHLEQQIQPPNVPITAYDVPPARAVSFSPHQRLLPEDLNQIQREIFFRGGRGGLTDSAAGHVFRVIVTTLNAGLGTDRVVDSSLDWRRRFIATEGFYQNQAGGYSAPTSILPGDGAETSLAAGGINVIWGWGHSLAGGADSEFEASPASVNVIWHVDAATGALRVKKDAALTSVNVVALVWATGHVSGESGDDILREYTHDQDDSPDTSTLDALMEAHCKIGNTGNVSYPNIVTGGLQRFGFVANLVRPSSPGIEVRVLDASADWRDRLIVIDHAYRIGDYGILPGGDDATIDSDFPTTTAFYSGAGAVDGVGTSTATWQHPLPITFGLYVYADSVTGALKVQLKSNATTGGPRSLAFNVRASGQLGVHEIGVAPPALPVHGFDWITPADLHVIQDGSIAVQFQPGRRRLATEEVPIESEAYPFGRTVTGVPRVPRELRYRERLGDRADIERARLAQRRPFIPGALRFPVAVEVLDSTVVFVDTSDFRDRIMSLRYRLSTSDIRPGGAGEDVHNAETPVHWCVYTASGWELEMQSDVFLRATDGGLQISNGSGGTLYFTAIVETTGMLGPRSRG